MIVKTFRGCILAPKKLGMQGVFQMREAKAHEAFCLYSMRKRKAAVLACRLSEVANQVELGTAPVSRPGATATNSLRTAVTPYLFATLAVTLAWALRALMDPLLGNDLPYTIFLVAVAFAGL